MTTMQALQEAFRALRARTDFVPRVALTLGSGLGGFAECIRVADAVAYDEIPHMPRSGVEGHAGRFLFGELAGVPIVCMQGRVHYYEGYTTAQAVTGVRLMGMLGAKDYIVTNAAGGIAYPQIGTLMRITDQICMVPSPLIGPNDASLGVRFPDMTRAYDAELGQIADDVAREQGLDLKKGVYIQFGGPNFETPAEIRMARALGADAVGMSTAIETIAARHMGMRVLGISCITNPAAGIGQGTLSHVDVQHAADLAGARLQALIAGVVERIGKERTC